MTRNARQDSGDSVAGSSEPIKQTGSKRNLLSILGTHSKPAADNQPRKLTELISLEIGRGDYEAAARLIDAGNAAEAERRNLVERERKARDEEDKTAKKKVEYEEKARTYPHLYGGLHGSPYRYDLSIQFAELLFNGQHANQEAATGLVRKVLESVAFHHSEAYERIRANLAVNNNTAAQEEMGKIYAQYLAGKNDSPENFCQFLVNVRDEVLLGLNVKGNRKKHAGEMALAAPATCASAKAKEPAAEGEAAENRKRTSAKKSVMSMVDFEGLKRVYTYMMKSYMLELAHFINLDFQLGYQSSMMERCGGYKVRGEELTLAVMKDALESEAQKALGAQAVPLIIEEMLAKETQKVLSAIEKCKKEKHHYGQEVRVYVQTFDGKTKVNTPNTEEEYKKFLMEHMLARSRERQVDVLGAHDGQAQKREFTRASNLNIGEHASFHSSHSGRNLVLDRWQSRGNVRDVSHEDALAEVNATNRAYVLSLVSRGDYFRMPAHIRIALEIAPVEQRGEWFKRLVRRNLIPWAKLDEHDFSSHGPRYEDVVVKIRSLIKASDYFRDIYGIAAPCEIITSTVRAVAADFMSEPYRIDQYDNVEYTTHKPVFEEHLGALGKSIGVDFSQDKEVRDAAIKRMEKKDTAYTYYLYAAEFFRFKERLPAEELAHVRELTFKRLMARAKGHAKEYDRDSGQKEYLEALQYAVAEEMPLEFRLDAVKALILRDGIAELVPIRTRKEEEEKKAGAGKQARNEEEFDASASIPREDLIALLSEQKNIARIAKRISSNFPEANFIPRYDAFSEQYPELKLLVDTNIKDNFGKWWHAATEEYFATEEARDTIYALAYKLGMSRQDLAGYAREDLKILCITAPQKTESDKFNSQLGHRLGLYELPQEETDTLLETTLADLCLKGKYAHAKVIVWALSDTPGKYDKPELIAGIEDMEKKVPNLTREHKRNCDCSSCAAYEDPD